MIAEEALRQTWADFDAHARGSSCSACSGVRAALVDLAPDGRARVRRLHERLCATGRPLFEAWWHAVQTETEAHRDAMSR